MSATHPKHADVVAAIRNLPSGKKFIAAVLFYYLVTSLFAVWKIDAFLKDVLVAPLYILVPTGFGLFVLSVANIHERLMSWARRGQIIVCASFIGLVSVTLVYQEAERYRVLPVIFPYLYPAIKALSVLGFLRAWRLFEFGDQSFRNAAWTLVVIGPVAVITYYFLYIQFSSYPLRDIFQQMHFMKGALELSKFQILNPFVSSAYLSIIQVHLGLLHHFYGYDLINSQWILPVCIYFFHLACYYLFFSALTDSAAGIRIALALATVLAPMFAVENMILLESMTLVFFSMLVRAKLDERGMARPVAVVMLLAALFGLYYLHFHYLYAGPASYASMWAFALAMLYLVSIAGGKSATVPAFLAFFAVSMFAVHRGILLFLPIVLFLYLVHAAVFRAGGAGRAAVKYAVLKAIFTGFTLLVLSILALDYLLTTSTDAGDAHWSSDFMWRIGETLLQTEVLVGAGTGFNHSLVEYLRLSPPALLLLVFVLLAIYVFHGPVSKLFGRAVPAPEGDPRAPFLNHALFFVLTIPPLALAVLSTIPYVYRGAFFPALLTIGLFATLLEFYRKAVVSRSPRTASRAAVLLALASVLLGHFVLYGHAPDLVGNPDPYLAALFPLPQAALVLLVIALLVLFSRWWRRALVLGLVPAALVVAISADGINFRTMFYTKAYGADLPADNVISHYTLQDLRLAESMKEYPPQTIFVSDPYTLSILRSVTGLNSLYSFANINLVTDAARYKQLFRFILEDDAGGTIDEWRGKFARLWEAVSSTGGEEAAYFLKRWRSARALTHGDIYTDYVWVISDKTFQWTLGADGYYPSNRRLDRQFIERHIHPYFDVITNLDDRLLALRLKKKIQASVPGLGEDRRITELMQQTEFLGLEIARLRRGPPASVDSGQDGPRPGRHAK